MKTYSHSAQHGGVCLSGRESHFDKELRRRVCEYFRSSGTSPFATPATWLKVFICIGVYLGSYCGLVLCAHSWWQAAPLVGLLAVGIAGIASNVQHDGSHAALSRRAVFNHLAKYALELIGASSYVWKWRHIRAHHFCPNAAGVDVDNDASPFLRLAPWQARRSYHRWQAVYCWLLYALMVMAWHFVSDFYFLWRGVIGERTFPRPRGAALAGLVVGKVGFFCFAFVVPTLFHPLWVVAATYAMACGIAGLIPATVVQLSHCVDGLEVHNDLPVRKMSWSEYQVIATADFAPRNWLFTWLFGGLNFQVEHHLFPRICHVHYGAIAPIIESVCREHGVPYVCHPSLFDALCSHIRWLRRMGRE